MRPSAIYEISWPAVWLLVLLAASAAFFFPGSAAAQAPKAATVLVIYSFHEKMPWQHQVRLGLTEGLAAGKEPVTLFEESMDTGRFPDPEQIGVFTEYLEKKYAGRHLDALMTESGPASLLMEARQDLFPGVPRLIVNPATSLVGASRDSAGVSVIPIQEDILSAFDAMVKVTGCRRAVVVGEAATPSVRETVNQLKKHRPSGLDGVEVDYLLDLPMDELLEKVGDLPEGASIFYTLIFQDGTGKTFIPYEAARLIAERASAPVFSHWDTLMGSGIAGGYLLSGRRVGETAAAKLRSLPASGKIGSDPAVAGRLFSNQYDWRVLNRFGIDERRLPADAAILFQQPSHLREHWGLFLGLGGLILVLTTLVLFLTYALKQRRQALDALERERANLEERVMTRTQDLSLSNQRLEQLNMEMTAKNQNLETALAEIRTLRGFLPICANCKRIRDDQGYWNQIEKYIQARSEAVFSHSICPDCLKKLYPDVAERVLAKADQNQT